MSRAALRQAIRTAVTADSYFDAFTALPTWSQNIDTDALPAWGVVTPTEDDERVAKDLLQRTIQVVCGLKREGGTTLDDDIDQDAERFEATVGQALKAVAFDAEIQSTRISFSGDAKKRIGTAQLTFICVLQTDITFPA